MSNFESVSSSQSTLLLNIGNTDDKIRVRFCPLQIKYGHKRKGVSAVASLRVIRAKEGTPEH